MLTRHAAVQVSFGSLMVQRDQWDTYWGPKKIYLLIRDGGDATTAGASMESCQFVVLRSPRGRLGSVKYMCNRLQRMRGRFDRGSTTSRNNFDHIFTTWSNTYSEDDLGAKRSYSVTQLHKLGLGSHTVDDMWLAGLPMPRL